MGFTNVAITNGKSRFIYNGKTHDFDWAIPNSKLLNYQRVDRMRYDILMTQNDIDVHLTRTQSPEWKLWNRIKIPKLSTLQFNILNRNRPPSPVWTENSGGTRWTWSFQPGYFDLVKPQWMRNPYFSASLGAAAWQVNLKMVAERSLSLGLFPRKSFFHLIISCHRA